MNQPPDTSHTKPKRKSRFVRRSLWLLILLAALVPLAWHFALPALAGAFDHEPEELAEGLSSEARVLVDAAFEGVGPHDLRDLHVHLAGLGMEGTGAYVNPRLTSLAHPRDWVRFQVYMHASGVVDLERADQEFEERFVRLARGFPVLGVSYVLAFDGHYTPGGGLNQDETEFHVPDRWAWQVSQRSPDVLAAAVSIHPYRPGAIEAVEIWASRGVKLIKWLPNSMGIDPSADDVQPFLEAVRKHGMVILTHTGEEQAVESEEGQALGNPLLWRRALDSGVTVIMAHCASLGTSVDLDAPDRAVVSSFELFARLMDEEQYEGSLYGEISGMTQVNRLGAPLRTVLERQDWHARLVNGSDYPIPAVNCLIQTRRLVSGGYITAPERAALNEIYDYNPLLFDYVLKRTLRHPETGAQLPLEIFVTRPELGL